MSLIDLTAQKFGRLAVLFRGPSDGKVTQWFCRCECGEETLVRSQALRKNIVVSCGCYKRDRLSKRLIDIKGKKFGRYTVLYRGPANGKVTYWYCRCECGKEKLVKSRDLRSKLIISCGCYKRDRATTHGQGTGDKRYLGYLSWQGMKSRCYNSKHLAYARYGGRGIKVCDRWLHSFEDFIADIGPRPSRRHSLDRIDNDGHYEPNNCRWATRKEQRQNQKTTAKMVLYRGQQITVAMAVQLAGDRVRVNTALGRLRVGWSVEAAVETISWQDKA